MPRAVPNRATRRRCAAPRRWRSRTTAARRRAARAWGRASARRMLRRPRAIDNTKASDSDRLRAASSSASDSVPDSHCSSHGLTLATAPKRTPSARSSLRRQLGVHHQPADLGGRLGVDACLHALHVFVVDLGFRRFHQQAVEHHQLQVAVQPQLGNEAQLRAHDVRAGAKGPTRRARARRGARHRPRNLRRRARGASWQLWARAHCSTPCRPAFGVAADHQRLMIASMG